MKINWWDQRPATQRVTGLGSQDVLVVMPKGLVPWTRESVQAEIKYWEEQDPSRESVKKLGEYRALLANLKGK